MSPSCIASTSCVMRGSLCATAFAADGRSFLERGPDGDWDAIAKFIRTIRTAPPTKIHPATLYCEFLFLVATMVLDAGTGGGMTSSGSFPVSILLILPCGMAITCFQDFMDS